MINPLKHYSIESVPTVFDEEAMTALELCARTAGKVNQVIDGLNQTNTNLDRNANDISDVNRKFTHFNAHLEGIAETLGELVVEPLGFATPQMFGATGDGVADDTQAIKAAIQSLSDLNPVLYFPPGTYLVTEDIELRDNLTVKGAGSSSVIKRAPNDETNYRVFRCRDVFNVVISGLTVQGDKYEHTGAEGEWGNCISLEGVTNVTIERCYVMNGWGDGIYIGGEVLQNQYVTIRDTKIIGNRRNGISVINVYDLTIDGCTISDTTGTAPQAGIDFEPNLLGQTATNVKVMNTTFANNNGSDVLFADTTNNLHFEKQVLFTGCVFKSKSGLDWRTPLTFMEGAPSISGYVKYSGCQFINSTRCIRVTKGNWDTPISLVGCDLSSNSICVEIGESGKTYDGTLGGVYLLNCQVLKNGNNPVIRGVGSGATFQSITADLYTNKDISAYGYFSGDVLDTKLDFHNGVYAVGSRASFDKYKIPSTIYISGDIVNQGLYDFAENFPKEQTVRVINDTDMPAFGFTYMGQQVVVAEPRRVLHVMITRGGKLAVLGGV